jgi:hypothetical protein
MWLLPLGLKLVVVHWQGTIAAAQLNGLLKKHEMRGVGGGHLHNSS